MFPCGKEIVGILPIDTTWARHEIEVTAGHEYKKMQNIQVVGTIIDLKFCRFENTVRSYHKFRWVKGQDGSRKKLQNHKIKNFKIENFQRAETFL